MEKWQDKERQKGESYSYRESWSRKEYIRKEIKGCIPNSALLSGHDMALAGPDQCFPGRI